MPLHDEVGVGVRLCFAPDCVVFDGSENANEGIEQEANEANSESDAAHHDPAIPNPTASVYSRLSHQHIHTCHLTEGWEPVKRIRASQLFSSGATSQCHS